MSRQQVKNPWGLTLCQVDVLDAMCSEGSIEAAAKKLRWNSTTARAHAAKAARRMGVKVRILQCIAWDRWRQGEGKGVSA